ncbi:unnamed protein product [Rotaria magnacalcarata]|uniref:Phosphoinositide phospholipase C n=2 Tax=Rotaria magnacalcarata TaxID=392030 RepID=A0A819FLX5_9BILA|nr:unnamed protein product [Rotaria magnacalcarata]CAF1941258.1 unnamed protein product [Rotaria magnacalcarata]CAF2163416.1 unnamed protein product [Rotaria magnacalcarata]CAF3870326.1 unnamed protein product [Rotaria magnacalcarata]CAF4056301.1 unnamed protein product [Rotaria magnacalcarata]
MASHNDNDVTEILQRLKSGSALTKCKPNGKEYLRQFFLHDRESFISYGGSRKIFGKPQIYNIKDIDEIRIGFAAETFDRLMKRGIVKSVDQNRAFSIIYDDHRKGEHLLASNTATRDLWVTGLEYLKNQNAQKSQYHFVREKNWILDFFHSADKDQSNKLTKDECRALLEDSLNVKMPDAVFERMFNQVDKSRQGALNQVDFVNFFNLLTHRKDLFGIMKTFIKNGSEKTMENISMNRNELYSFLEQAENENIKNIDNPTELQRLIDTYELNNEFREKGLLSLDGFRNMLLSRSFDIIESVYSRQVYQDMTRPLCDYYISTSHNTYLFYSQVSGNSDPEAYNHVLLMGCRAVEFDCYDGDDGKPIVKHAFTLVKSCSFESIIRCIEPNLFKVSPYPVIFNIENHCSSKQQKEMARILKTILGDKLITKRFSKKDPSILPSPEDLKYKVLIRVNIFLFKDTESESDELFVYLLNVPFREYDYARKNYTALNSSSLNEGDFLKSAQKDPTGFVQQTTWRILRTYPDGLRQDSSNQNPVHAWNFGVQMAALNYQTLDDMMPLNCGKFLDNGSCGYILKPDYLIDAEDTEFNPWNPEMNFDDPQILTITIISGQFLLRSDSKSKDITDAYVKISTHGLPCDEQTHQTKVIDNNGFDPIWNEKFQFHIKFPQMCLIYFAVLDYDTLSSDDRMAYFCAPIKMIQTGYRHIHLRANNNDATYSTLFVHIDVEKYKNVGLHDNVIRLRF